MYINAYVCTIFCSQCLIQNLLIKQIHTLLTLYQKHSQNSIVINFTDDNNNSCSKKWVHSFNASILFIVIFVTKLYLNLFVFFTIVLSNKKMYFPQIHIILRMLLLKDHGYKKRKNCCIMVIFKNKKLPLGVG